MIWKNGSFCLFSCRKECGALLDEFELSTFYPSSTSIKLMTANAVSPSLIGFGGLENDLTLISINREKKKISNVFQAKNVKNTDLDLRQPVHITGLVLLEGDVAVISSQFGYLRWYKITTMTTTTANPHSQQQSSQQHSEKKKSRPFKQVNLSNSALVCMEVSHDKKYYLILPFFIHHLTCLENYLLQILLLV